MTKKKQPIKTEYSLEEAANLAGVYTSDIKSIVHEMKMTMKLEKGKIFLDKKEFDLWLEKRQN